MGLIARDIGSSDYSSYNVHPESVRVAGPTVGHASGSFGTSWGEKPAAGAET